MTVAVIDYSNAADPLAAMKAAAAARRARLYAPRPEPVAPVVVVPEPVALPIAKPKPDYIRDWIGLATPEAMRPAASSRIIAIVAQVTGVTRLDILSERRAAYIVRARQICFYLMRHCSTLSLPEIARRVGGRDHTTALHGVRKIADLIETDADLRALVRNLTARIQAEAA